MNFFEAMLPAIRPMLKNIEINIITHGCANAIAIIIRNTQTDEKVAIRKKLPLKMSLEDVVIELEKMK